MGSLTDTILEILFPSVCTHCGEQVARGEVVCAACMEGITIARSLVCGHCGSRLPEAKKTCHKEVPYMLAACGAYADPTLRDLIHAMKFRSVGNAAEPLARLAAEHLRSLPLPLATFMVVPVPLSPKRERMRGFNQSSLVGKALARILNLPFKPELLVRIRHARPQSDLHNHAARHANVAGVFAATPSPLIQQTRILLVDDVITSGATLSEASRALIREGARNIVACVLAKA